LFPDVCGQRHLHVGGHTDAGGTAIATIVAKPIVAANITPQLRAASARLLQSTR
jgi:hypothetical protein